MSSRSASWPALESPASPRALPSWLTPSFTDLLFLSLFVWLFAAGSSGWLGLLIDGDTGWHIRTGEYILAQGQVPRADLYSYSKPGQAWFAWEWLADVTFAAAHRAAGLKGVVLLGGIVITLAPLVVFRHMLARGANVLVALVVCLVGVGASSVHHLARPHIFSILLLAVSLRLLDQDRRAPGWRVWLLAPLTALWTNLHGGFVALPACLLLLAAGQALETRFSRDGLRSGGRYLLLAAGCLAASLANPYGFRLHQHIFAYLRSDWIRKVVEEFQSPSFREENMLQFELLLFLGLLAAGSLLRRNRISEALWVLLWAHAGLSSVRHIPLFAVASGPLLAEELTRWWDEAAASCSRRSVWEILRQVGRDLSAGFGRLSLWAASPLLALALLNGPVKWPADFPELKFPVKMADRFGERLSRERLLTSDQWADYLIYRYYPRQKVFFDGRSDFYGQELGTEYARMMQGHHQWRALVAKHGFELILCPVDWPLASLLKLDPQWRMLADDGRGVLFERRGGPGAAKSDTRQVVPQTRKGALMERDSAAESTKGDHRG